MFRGTKKAIIEIDVDPAGDTNRYVWRKVGPNGRHVCESSETFSARRYAAVAGRLQFPKLKVLHKYVDVRLEQEADARPVVPVAKGARKK